MQCHYLLDNRVSGFKKTIKTYIIMDFKQIFQTFPATIYHVIQFKIFRKKIVFSQEMIHCATYSRVIAFRELQS